VRKGIQRLRSTWIGPTAIGLLFFGGIAVRAGFGDHFQYFKVIQVGQPFLKPSVLLPGQPRLPNAGYDGQFYFALAEDPFLTRPDTASSLDGTFRYRRLLYPLLAWALSLGQRALVPYSLVLVNVLAACALVAVAARAAQRAGVTPWAALVVAGFPGVWIPVLLDLTEPLHLALLAAGMVAGSAGLTLLSALAKETAAVALFSEALRAAVARDWVRGARHGAALAGYLAWAALVQVIVRGAHSNAVAFHFLDPPGAPLFVLAHDLASRPVNFFLAAPAAAFCLLAIVRLARARDGAGWAGAAYAVLVLASGTDIWVDFTGYYRIMAGVVVLVFLSWCATRDALGRYMLLLGGVTWILVTAFALLLR
jgi:hypothetical protein